MYLLRPLLCRAAQECLRNLAQHNTYVCPVCSKTYVNAQYMEALWGEMDAAVEATPMPQEYSTMNVSACTLAAVHVHCVCGASACFPAPALL